MSQCGLGGVSVLSHQISVSPFPTQLQTTASSLLDNTQLLNHTHIFTTQVIIWWYFSACIVLKIWIHNLHACSNLFDLFWHRDVLAWIISQQSEMQSFQRAVIMADYKWDVWDSVLRFGWLAPSSILSKRGRVTSSPAPVQAITCPSPKCARANDLSFCRCDFSCEIKKMGSGVSLFGQA